MGEGTGKRRTHEFTANFDSVSPTMAVVESVASVLGRNPREIPPLSDELETDAFDQLVVSSESTTVSFEFEGLEVVVHGSGEVVVHE